MGFAEMGMTYSKEPYQIPGTNWFMAHGDEGNISQHAGITAINLSKKWGVSTIIGHTHRLGMSSVSEAVGSRYRALHGIEVGNLMDRKKASYLRHSSANWQNGVVLLEVVGKAVTPTLIPIDPKDGSFTALGRHYGA